MAVIQVIKWKCTDGTEFDTEDEALTHAVYLVRKEELALVLDQIWHRGVTKEDVIEVLLNNFEFTKKD